MHKVPDPEELAGSMYARVMADWHLRHSESRAFEFLGHFNADDAASGFECDDIEDVPPKQPEVAIDIANR